MKTEQMKIMEDFLDSENALLDQILENQSVLRKSVNERNWDVLMKTNASLEDLAERFSKVETARSAISNDLTAMPKDVREKLTQVRSKLVKSQAENKALGEYVSIMGDFVRGVIEEAVPQRKAKIYGSNGRMVDAQASSILVNRFF